MKWVWCSSSVRPDSDRKKPPNQKHKQLYRKYVFIHVYPFLYLLTNMNTCVCMYIYTHIHTFCLLIHVYTYIYKYKYTFIHIHSRDVLRSSSHITCNWTSESHLTMYRCRVLCLNPKTPKALNPQTRNPKYSLLPESDQPHPKSHEPKHFRLYYPAPEAP